MSANAYAYLNARVNLMAAKLLDTPRIEALIERPAEMSGTLVAPSSSFSAEQYLGDLDQSNVTLLLKDLAILLRPLSGKPRELMEYWAHRFEINNLKVIIRGKMANQPQQKIEEQLLDMGRLTSLPLAELLQSDSPAELLRRLEQTPYAEIARQARHLLEQGESLFALDAALDRRYFAGLSRRSKELDHSSAGLLRDIVGSIVDRVNLVWLLRYRFAYNLPPAQTYYLLIPASHRLSARKLQLLAQQPSFEEVLASLEEPYASLLADARNTTEVTLRLERETWRIAMRALKLSQFNVARALAYLVLRERDLRRLRAIIRGHDIQVDAVTIRTALGLSGPEARHV